MTENRDDRFGWRARFAHFESTLRLLGGANTTGAITAGAAFHAFEKNLDVQGSVKVAAVLFLFGIFTFVISYATLFMAIHDIDHSLEEGKPNWPEDLFWAPTKSAEDYRKSAKLQFGVSMLAALASFILLFVGLGMVVMMGARLALT
jgi:uncharacterized membrane protein YhaH (DUF805 family)